MDPVILSACRTPIGKHKGALSSCRPDDLLATVLKEAVSRSQVASHQIDECFAGCANQAGEDNRNVARMSVLLAGLPNTLPAATVNRLCASGLEAIVQASRAIQTQDAQVVLAGGVESMSRAPIVQDKLTGATFDSSLGWRFKNPKLETLFPLESMGETAENIAEKYQIIRSEQDLFAFTSHQKAVHAQKNGYFDAELLRLPELSQDEGPRPEASLEKLASLKTIFRQNGSVTAGNSSSLNDGASALVLASPTFAQTHSLKPLGRILGVASIGLDPRYMGLGPLFSTQKLLKKLGLSIHNLDLIELNEAFAVQALAVIRELNLDPSQVNISGGALALGHPLGCSGARIVTTLLYNLRRTQKRIGLATLCVGVGQGLSIIIENNMLS